MAFHDDLLEQARHLALRERRRPRQASLRRAVSAAYYALFHLLSAEASGRLSPPRPSGLRARVGRALGHAAMYEACYQFEKGSPIPATARLLSCPLEAEPRYVAGAFVELQDSRHVADYDLSASFDRLAVLRTVDAARQAFEAWDIVKNRPNAAVFLAALLLQRQWR